MSTSQNQAVLEHLLTKGPLTPKQAMDLYGIYRLAARVKDLRDQGFGIHTQTVEVQNRHGELVRVASYSLVMAKAVV